MSGQLDVYNKHRLQPNPPTSTKEKTGIPTSNCITACNKPFKDWKAVIAACCACCSEPTPKCDTSNQNSRSSAARKRCRVKRLITWQPPRWDMRDEIRQDGFWRYKKSLQKEERHNCGTPYLMSFTFCSWLQFSWHWDMLFFCETSGPQWTNFILTLGETYLEVAAIPLASITAWMRSSKLLGGVSIPSKRKPSWMELVRWSTSWFFQAFKRLFPFQHATWHFAGWGWIFLIRVLMGKVSEA